MAVDFNRDVYCVLGLPFDAIDLSDTVRRIETAVARRVSCFVSTPNTNIVIATRADRVLRESVIQSDLSVVDGMPIVWIARVLGIPIRHRVAGSEMFEILRRRQNTQMSVFLFGGRDGVAEVACRRLNEEARGVTCAGFASPGFGSVDAMSSEDTIAGINASGADFVVVSLGAKKGQEWILRNRARLTASVVCYLGAVINFVAGQVRRAPIWMQRAGLEWLWRVREEPVLWRRYFRDGLALLWLVATRVMPYAWFMYQKHPRQEDLGAATIATSHTSEEFVIHLKGAWVVENSKSLRECFASAADSNLNVRIDLEHVTYVDAGFIALTLLLYGAQQSRGRRLSCGPINRTVRKIFRYGCSEFLLRDGSVQINAESVA